MSKTSPTQRTKAVLKKRGAIHQVVERWNAHASVRVDLFGVIDIVALSEVDGFKRCLGIQCTAKGWADRMAKAEAEPRLIDWLAAGCLFEVWGWRKLKMRNKGGKIGKRERWVSRVHRAEMTEGVITWREIEDA